MNRRGFLGAMLTAPLVARAHPPAAAPGSLIDLIARRYRVVPEAVQTVVTLAVKYFPENPALILAIVGVESSWRPWAVGAVGEVGLCQVRPGMHGASAAELMLPDGNIATAAGVLRRCFARAGGDPTRAVARYNGAGPAAERYAKKVLAEHRRITGRNAVAIFSMPT